jgi:predicted RNA-binding Zn ribbon-like protein
MQHAWTEKQFVGGTVALDFVNTVCYREDPARRFDKISGREELLGFAEAAQRLSDATGRPAATPGPDPDDVQLAFYRAIREAIDALFRSALQGGTPEITAFQALLRLHHDLLSGRKLRVGDYGLEIDATAGLSFALVVTQSAMRLAASSELKRLKRCPNCHWLFIDRSRNASRIWCDMLTCGNRAKAERHYRKRRAAASLEPA